ncbi:ribonucleoside reductase class II [archaeon]|nr:ribonucleoside reductase class II [archaeon]
MSGDFIISRIRKRDGRIVSFNQEKITNAIFKATAAVNKPDLELAGKLSGQVVSLLLQKRIRVPGVEEVQDLVEMVLIENNLADVAKAYIIYRQKRKELREAKQIAFGIYDELKLSLNALKVLESRYLLKNRHGQITETPKQLFHRVAHNISLAENKYSGRKQGRIGAEKEFFELMASLDFMPNSPTLMNAGTSLQQLSACFVLPVEDAIESIFSSIKNAAIIFQSGGGCGYSFSRLRPKGDNVKSTQGIASGPVTFMDAFNVITEVIKQGGKRRGANMGIMNVDHPDILEFIAAKEKEGRLNNFNISVALTGRFMKAVIKNEDYPLINPRNGKAVKRLNARKVFGLIVTMAWKNGEPGVIFIDEMNKHNPTPEIGRFESTNPCVAGGTFIATSQGPTRIKDLVGKTAGIMTDNRVPITVLNSNGTLSELLVKQQGLSSRHAAGVFSTGIKEVFRLVTKAGYELDATADHKVMTVNGWRQLKDLVPGKDSVLIQQGKGLFNECDGLPFKPENKVKGNNGRSYEFNLPAKWSGELGQVLGWLVGDGFISVGKEQRVEMVFGKGDEVLADYFKHVIESFYGKKTKMVSKKSLKRLSYHSRHFADFFSQLGVKPVYAEEKEVPFSLFSAPKGAVVGFLQGLFSSDGTVRLNPKKNSGWVALTSKSRKLLKQVQLLLLNLGIKSSILDRSRNPRNIFPYTTVKGEKKTYYCDGRLFELGIFGASRERFRTEVGFLNSFKQRKLDGIEFEGFYKEKFSSSVESIESKGSQEVFDLTEPITHSMIANGLVVHQCGEVPLLPFEACNLGSINLGRMVKDGRVDWDRLRNTARTSAHFLDNVIDMSKFPLPKITEMVHANRKIGLGVMGWADLLLQLGIPYNSVKAIKLAERIMKAIKKEAESESIRLAKQKGVFPNWQKSIYAGKKRVRNATITTIAPAGTISIIANASSGIEPLFAVSFIRKVLEGQELLEINPFFEKTARDRGFYSDELMRKIALRGSIQGMKEIPVDVQRTFVTAMDIAPDWHVKMQAAFQKFTDNAVSKTINFPNSATVEDVERAFLLAYRLKCKGITIYRYGSREQQVLNIAGPSEAEKQLKEEVPAELQNANCPTCQL